MLTSILENNYFTKKKVINLSVNVWVFLCCSIPPTTTALARQNSCFEAIL